MNEPYFYANLAHHLAVAGILEPGLWAKLREVAPERLREVLPEELPDRLGDWLGEKRPELDDLRAWIEAARQFVPSDAEDALDAADAEVRARKQVGRTRAGGGLGIMADTAPLSEERQLEFQRDLLKSVRDWCAGIRKRLGPFKRPPEVKPGDGRPSVRLEHERFQRLLLLDGERGTGKTALLLSLVADWQAEQKLAGVLPIGILDFDPMPEGVGTYPWLLTAFRPWARFLDQKRKPAEPGCRPFNSLSTAFDEVYRNALLGWNRLDGGVSRDERVADAREADAGWAHLREGWTDFVNLLFGAALDAGIVAEDGLFMLGVDDLDLNERNVRDLLGALRLLSHPRVAVIMTGHRRRLEQVLTRELYREASLGLPVQSVYKAQFYQDPQMKPEDRLAFDGVYGQPGEARQVALRVEQDPTAQDDLDPLALKHRARLLAAAMLNKVVPQYLSVPKLSLHDALVLAATLSQSGPGPAGRVELVAWLAKALNRELEGRKVFHREAEKLVHWLEVRERDVAPEPCLTVRAVVSAAALGDRAWETLAAMLENATNDDGEGVLNALPTDERVEMTPSALDWSHKAPVLQATSFTVLLAPGDESLPAVAELGVRIGWPFPFRWKAVKASSVVSTLVRLRDTDVPVGWPMPEGRWSLHSNEAMARAFERLPYEAPDDMLRVWLAWWTGTGAPKSWSAGLPELSSLLERLGEQARKDLRIRTWALRGLPLLTAPEHGLSDASIDAVYGFTRALYADKDQDWSRLAEEWGSLREAQYKETLGARAPGELADALERFDRGSPWAARLTLGGSQWYDVPTPAGRPVLFAIERLGGIPTVSALSLFSVPEQASGRERRRPLWSATALTDFLAGGSRGNLFRKLVDGLPSRGSVLPYLVNAWTELCQMADLPGQAERVRLNENEDGLTISGPAIELRPIEVGFEEGRDFGYLLKRVKGWTAWQDGENLNWPPALVGWLGQLQAVLWRTAHPADSTLCNLLTVVHPTFLASSTYAPPLPAYYDWLDIERIRVMWDLILDRLVPMGNVGMQARKRFLLANWLHSVLSIRHQDRLPSAPHAEIPVKTDALSNLMDAAFGGGHLMMRYWLRNFQIEKLADAAVTTEWHRVLNKRLAGARIDKSTAVTRLLTNARDKPQELHELLADREAARALIEFVSQQPGYVQEHPSGLLHIVGPDAWARIQTWMELGG